MDDVCMKSHQTFSSLTSSIAIYWQHLQNRLFDRQMYEYVCMHFTVSMYGISVFLYLIIYLYPDLDSFLCPILNWVLRFIVFRTSVQYTDECLKVISTLPCSFLSLDCYFHLYTIFLKLVQSLSF